MGEKWNKVKDFVVDHKQEIGIGVCSVAGAVVGVVLLKRFGFKAPAEKAISTIKNLDIPKFDIGVVDDLWSDEFGTNLILNDVTVADLGKVGEQFLKIDGVNPETVVTAVVGLLNEN